MLLLFCMGESVVMDLQLDSVKHASGGDGLLFRVMEYVYQY